MSWRNVSVSKPSRLSLKNENLVIRQEDGELTIPLQDVATLMLEDGRTVITRKLLEALTRHKVVVFTCDSKHMPSGVFLPLGGHCRQVKILKMQVGLSKPFKKRVWQRIVAKKIENQGENLNLCSKDGSEVLKTLARGVKSGDRGNMESYAAREYFRYLFESDFSRQQSNWINSALNYGYAIIRGAIARSLVKYGFHPALGIHHKSELNPFNLADDFIEPLRPLVDLWAFKNDRGEEELTREDRHGLYCLLNVDILLDEKHYRVLTAIDEMIKSFSHACEKSRYDHLKLPGLLPLKEHSYE